MNRDDHCYKKGRLSARFELPSMNMPRRHRRTPRTSSSRNLHPAITSDDSNVSYELLGRPIPSQMLDVFAVRYPASYERIHW
jgi:hypothetical protein